MREVYQNEEEANVADDTLEAMVREGARRMLAAALEEEVSGFLGRDRYERGEEFRGYRNGYHRSRELTVGVSAVEVKAPRVSDVPAEVAGGGFESKIVRRYERTSRQTQDLFRKLYLEGLSTGDFEPVFRELVGETAALSPNAIVRLKSKWESEYRAWCSRKLEECRYAYIWADGVYLGAGVDREKTALLCVVGAREDGVKELLGMELGYRESTESWSGVLRSLRDRGLSAPLLAVGDGALGLWAALDAVFPTRVIRSLCQMLWKLPPELRQVTGNHRIAALHLSEAHKVPPFRDERSLSLSDTWVRCALNSSGVRPQPHRRTPTPTG